MKEYLASNRLIDWHSTDVLSKAQQLAVGCQDKLAIAEQCFQFVRDKIKHSMDYQLNPVTCVASDVLKYETGFCYAKSHLLAALLRANNIPAGFCYQRLTITGESPPFCLHGLNAVFLEQYGWYRIDARGNKVGVNAIFNPPVEQLAYPIVSNGELDLPEIWCEPLPIVVSILESYNTYQDVEQHLPDVLLF
ncbi:transglutaminase family protein [Candidatus Falkowbacteria bacterium]|nr:transglutaminase family protein [Candidatus Falkowbacteria bacterium]MBT7410066.1 transglutaminase family protein [Methylococcales bacterium]